MRVSFIVGQALIVSDRNGAVRRGANHAAGFLNDHPGWLSLWKITTFSLQQASSLTGTSAGETPL